MRGPSAAAKYARLRWRQREIFWRNLRFPAEWACRRTIRRRLNLYLNRWEHGRGRTRLRSYPWVLSIDPTNSCNLDCPFCFTGAGGLGRRRSTMSLELFRALLDEIGDYVILLKAYGWGEPLLCRHLETMLADAHARGICSVVNTNFSVPFDARRADALVASGLEHLVVSIDGARQPTYERYRVGGSLAKVVDNVRVVNAAKARHGSVTPVVTIEFHPFPWNVHEAWDVAALARDLGAELRVFKGNVPGEEWGADESWVYCGDPALIPCYFLWTTAVVASDGGVAPCNGTFYAADDMGRFDGRGRFRDVWNNERYRAARRFFQAREGTAAERSAVCFDCPNTVLWDRWRRHRTAGNDPAAFEIGINSNDTWNYFWSRRPDGALRAHDAGDVASVTAATPARAARGGAS